ncbi:DUF7848 domain-containing protein [Streptomyces achromogenes]|uniref:DUF7848 domain-containing protein n=1 Tax=Streptomyces achromogenes TaxID=67255 RepID=UPI003F4ED460
MVPCRGARRQTNRPCQRIREQRGLPVRVPSVHQGTDDAYAAERHGDLKRAHHELHRPRLEGPQAARKKPSECAETSDPEDNRNAVRDWRLRHTGRTGHGLFRRVVTDHARVTRDA